MACRFAAALEALGSFLILVFVAFRLCLSSLRAAHESNFPAVRSVNFIAPALLFVGLGCCLVARAIRSREPLRVSWLDAGPLVLLIAALFSSWHASFPLTASEFSISLAACLGGLYAGRHLLGRPAAGICFAYFFSLAAAVVLLGLLQRGILLERALHDPAAARLISTEDAVRTIRRLEPFSVFYSANQFAIFCVFTILMALGSMADAWRTIGRRAVDHFLLKGGLSIAALAGLYLSGSRGSGFALGAGLSFLLFRFLQSRRPALAWSLAFLSLAGGAAAAWAVSDLPSMRARFSSWGTAARMLSEDPWSGRGLNNFQEWEPRYKPESAPEVPLAYNDYMQALFELGPLGLAGLAVLMAGLVRSLGWPHPPAPSATGRPSPWLAASALGTGMIAAWFLSDPWVKLGGPGLGVGLLVFSIAVFFWRCLHEEKPLEDPRGTKTAMAAGVLALAVHMSVDFDFYEHALLAPVLLICGTGLALGSRGIEVGHRKPILIVASIGVLLIGLFGAILPAARLLPSDLDKARASEMLDSAAAPRTQEEIREGCNLLERAASHRADDPELFDRLGDVHYSLFKSTGSRDLLQSSIELADRAHSLRPRRASYLVKIGSRRIESGTPEDLNHAIEALAAASASSPDYTHAWYWLFVVYEIRGLRSQADRSRLEALRYHQLARTAERRLSDSMLKRIGR
jgi:hypothetical protein